MKKLLVVLSIFLLTSNLFAQDDMQEEITREKDNVKLLSNKIEYQEKDIKRIENALEIKEDSNNALRKHNTELRENIKTLQNKPKGCSGECIDLCHC